jgi:hypothetical protein
MWYLHACMRVALQVHEFVVERLDAGLPPEVICAQLCVESCVSEKTGEAREHCWPQLWVRLRG